MFIGEILVTKNGEFLATKFYLIKVGHTSFQLPTQFFDYNLKWPTIIFSVKNYCENFLSTYLDENSKAQQVLQNY